MDTNRHLQAIADMFIKRFEQISLDPCEQWLPVPSFSSQNARGSLYSGGNRTRLDAVCALKGFKTAVWVSSAQARELGIYILAGSIGSPIYWAGTEFINKNTGKVEKTMLWSDYEALSDIEKANYEKKDSLPREAYVFNIEQTDFPEKYPELWKELTEAFSPPHVPIEKCEEFVHAATTHGWYPDGNNRCAVKFVDSPSAVYDMENNVIEMPLRSHYDDPKDFYRTLIGSIVDSAMSQIRVRRQKKDDGLEALALSNLTEEIACSILRCRLGLEEIPSQQTLSSMKNWAEIISGNPSCIRRVTSDAGAIIDLVSSQLGVRNDLSADICDKIAKCLAQRQDSTKARKIKKGNGRWSRRPSLG